MFGFSETYIQNDMRFFVKMLMLQDAASFLAVKIMLKLLKENYELISAAKNDDAFCSMSRGEK